MYVEDQIKAGNWLSTLGCGAICTTVSPTLARLSRASELRIT